MPGKLAILGAGSWGTALAIALEKNFDSIALWGHDAERATRSAAGSGLIRSKFPGAVSLRRVCP